MASSFFYLMAVFYIIAGVNHFINPEFYYDLIPPYLPWPVAINVTSGVIEVLLGAMLLFRPMRKVASVLLIAMLLSFIPSHIYFVQVGSCIEGGLCVADWIGWVRLLVIHPLLIYWAYWVGFKFQK